MIVYSFWSWSRARGLLRESQTLRARVLDLHNYQSVNNQEVSTIIVVIIIELFLLMIAVGRIGQGKERIILWNDNCNVNITHTCID